MAGVTTIVLVVLVAAMTASGDAQVPAAAFGRSTSCAVSCPSATKFHYQSGMVHVFDYHASAKFLSGSREPQLGVSARAHITVAGQCEMILAMSHVRLTDLSEHDADFGADLIRNPLRFGFVDGKIVSVCPADDEPRWALNFKRAVLSTFQNSMFDFNSVNKEEWVKEEDVGGVCTSKYSSVQQDKGVYNITRSRSTTCIPPPPAPTSSIMNSLLQMLPLLYREQKCLQMISGSNMKEAICKENIRLPWDSNDELPLASLTTSLKLVYQFKADFVVVPNYEATRMSLALEWEDTSDDEASADWLSLSLDMIRKVDESAPSPTLFYRLTELLKLFNYSQLSDMFIKMIPEHWSTAMMSVVKLGTEPSMKLLLDFIKYDAISDRKASEIFAHLLKSYDVNSAMIDLMDDHLWYNTDETIGHKLHSYCLSNSSCYDDTRISSALEVISDVHSVPDCTVKEISNKTSEFVYYSGYSSSGGGGCFESDYNDNENVNIFNRWSEIGYWNDTLTQNLTTCLSTNSSDVKYAALAALRNSPCDKYDYIALLDLANNNRMDSYMDIMMYLTLIRCPTTNLTQFLRDKLTKNDVTQETSFIWTHLSNMKESFANLIVSDSPLRLKYASPVLKFSRNFRKNFEVMNKTFYVETNIIFTDYSLKPKYVSVKLSAEDMTVDLIDLEYRERNRTSCGVTTYCVTNIKVKGNLMYSDESESGASTFDFNFVSLYLIALSFGFQIFSMFSFSYLKILFDSYTPIDFVSREILLQYPTSIGMPFHIKLNKTMGTLSERKTLPSYTSKQMDIQMLIDATYTNVGTKIQTTWDVLPALNVTKTDKALEFVVELPENKNKIFDFNMGLYNIENNRISPRYYKSQSNLESACLPLLKNIIGSTLCWEYCPQTRWWPVSKLQYRLVSSRDNDIRGHNLTIIDDDNNEINTGGVYYRELGNSVQKWHFAWSILAKFVSFKFLTPHFSLNGEGTFSTQVLYLEESGQAMNITGILSSKNEVSPFTLTGFNVVDEKKKESKFEAFFNSSIFESKLISTYENDDNCSVVIDVPYRIKKNSPETIRFIGKSVAYNVTANVSRWEIGASLALSQYKTPVIATTAFIDTTKTMEGNNYDLSVNKVLNCTNHSMICELSGKWYTDFADISSTFEYTAPNKTVLIMKSLRMEDENNKVIHRLTCDDQTIYELEVNGGMSMMKGMHANASLLIPDPKEKYPLAKISIDGNMNFFSQHFHLLCSKSIRGESINLNVTAGVVLDKTTGLPVGFGESKTMHHVAVLELTCHGKDPFRIDADSQLSDSLQNLDLSVAVQTPFQSWDKEAFNLKLKKTGTYMSSTLYEKRKGVKEPITYSLEGITDTDVISNMLDFS